MAQINEKQQLYTDLSILQDYGEPLVIAHVREGTECVKYSNITPSIAKLIQEQQNCIDSLTERIEAIESQTIKGEPANE